MWPVVKALRNVFCSSIASRKSRVMKSARPDADRVAVRGFGEREGGDHVDPRAW